MLYVVDFRTPAGDTGRIADSLSIQPYTDGEAANQTILRRPVENVRSRSDVLQDAARDGLWRADFDRDALVGGGTITPSVSGSGYKFTMSAVLRAYPLVTGGSVTGVASTYATLSVGTPSNNELIFTSRQRAFQGITPQADVNSIAIEIVDGGVGADLAVVVTDLAIKITIDASVHTCNEVINLVAADPVADAIVDITLGAGSTGTNACPLFGATQWGSDYTARFLRGGVPGVIHEISTSGLSTFFGDTANALLVGDCLAVAYDKVISVGTTGGRIQSTPENANISVSTALFNTRRYPEKVPNCIPICKRVSATEFVFSNGAIITTTTPATLTFDSYALAGAENGTLATPLNWTRLNLGPWYIPPTTIRQALRNTDGYLNQILNSLDDNVLVVSDGVSSTGGDYSGPGAIHTAFGILQTGVNKGGVILVKKGSYSGTSMSFVYPIKIIALEEGVTLTFTNTASYSFVPRQLADGTVLDGLTVIALSNKAIHIDSNGMVDEAKRCTIRNCTITGAVLVNGAQAQISGCTIYEPTNAGGEGIPYVLGIVSSTATTPSCIVENTSVIAQTGGKATGSVVSDTASTVSAAPGTLFTNCYVQNRNGLKGIYCSFGQSTWTNTKGKVFANTAGAPFLTCEGGSHTFHNTDLTFDSSVITPRTGAVAVYGVKARFYNLKITYPTVYLYTFTQGNNPLYLEGDVIVEGLDVTFYIPDLTMGYTLDPARPLIFLHGLNGGIAILRDSTVKLVSLVAGGELYGRVIGTNADGDTTGTACIDNCTFDFTSYANINASTTFQCVAGLQEYSTVQSCTFTAGAAGRVASLISVDSRYVSVHKNTFKTVTWAVNRLNICIEFLNNSSYGSITENLIYRIAEGPCVGMDGLSGNLLAGIKLNNNTFRRPASTTTPVIIQNWVTTGVTIGNTIVGGGSTPVIHANCISMVPTQANIGTLNGLA
jgi:hypothetical protein